MQQCLVFCFINWFSWKETHSNEVSTPYLIDLTLITYMCVYIYIFFKKKKIKPKEVTLVQHMCLHILYSQFFCQGTIIVTYTPVYILWLRLKFRYFFFLNINRTLQVQFLSSLKHNSIYWNSKQILLLVIDCVKVSILLKIMSKSNTWILKSEKHVKIDLVLQMELVDDLLACRFGWSSFSQEGLHRDRFWWRNLTSC